MLSRCNIFLKVCLIFIFIIIFQSIFYLEIYWNNFFNLLKFIFNINILKWYENIKKINLKKQKIFNFFQFFKHFLIIEAIDENQS
jgi:hypothetical protein